MTTLFIICLWTLKCRKLADPGTHCLKLIKVTKDHSLFDYLTSYLGGNGVPERRVHPRISNLW